MLQQIKQIEEFFRNDTCEGEQMRYPAQQYEMKEAVNDSHTSKEVELLKKILGVADKYKKGFDNFRRRVIEPMVEAVNESQLLLVTDYEYLRTGRKITGIRFFFADGKIDSSIVNRSLPESRQQEFNFAAAELREEINSLTRAKLHAYQY